MSIQTTNQSKEFTVRQFEPCDREAFVSLHRQVFDSEKTQGWFTWKFEDNPFLDHVPVFVVEKDGQIVGSVGFFALRLRTETGTLLALEPCDGMVHPDYRRQGLYLKMMQSSIEYYTEQEPALYFDLLPGEATLSAHFNHLDWRRVDELPTCYRIQTPARLIQKKADNKGGKLAGHLLNIAARSYYTICDRFRNPGINEVTVDRYSSIPAEIFASLYHKQIPHQIHALRDKRFYRWRYTNPDWEYTGYIAQRDGSPVAGIITGTRQSNGVISTRLMDMVPMSANTPDHADAFAALLSRIVFDSQDADILAATPGIIPHTILNSYGFRRDDKFPLSHVNSPIRHGVRPLEPDVDEALVIDDKQLTDSTNWLFSFAEQDTC